MNTQRSIWDDAVEDFKSFVKKHSRTKSPRDDPKPPATIDELKNLLVDHNNQFDAFRSHREKLFHTLDIALRPIEALGDIAGGAASVAYPPADVIFGSVTYLIGAAHDVSKTYNQIEEMFESAGLILKRLEIYTDKSLNNDMIDIIKGSYALVLELCQVSARAVRKGRIGQFSTTVLLGREGAVQKTLEKLNRHLDNEKLTTAALTLKDTRAIRADISCTNDGIVRLESGVSDLVSMQIDSLKRLNRTAEEMHAVRDMFRKKSSRDEEEEQKLLINRTLKPNEDMVGELQRLLGQLLPCTCEWIIEEPSFENWLAGIQPLLLVTGGQSTGKSCLAAKVVQFLQERFQIGTAGSTSVRRSVCYFFLNDSSPAFSKLASVLSTLAWQISENDPVFRNVVVAACHQAGTITTRYGVWEVLFKAFFTEHAQVSTAYLVLDGIEVMSYKEREALFESLANLYSETPRISRLRIILCAASEITAELGSLERFLLRLDVTSTRNRQDIIKFTRSKVEKQVKWRKQESLREKVIRKISRSADGMFLHVNLMVKELAALNQPKQVLARLQEVPKKLFDILRLPLQRFADYHSHEDCQNLNTLLTWTHCGFRYFQLGQLESVLMIEADGEFFSIERMLRITFSPFFALMREDSKTTDQLLPSFREQEDSEADCKTDFTTGEEDTNFQDEDSEFPEPDNFFDFHSNPETTWVQISPSAYTNFFESVGTVSATKNGETVGVQAGYGHAQMVMSCLKLLCEKEDLSKRLGRKEAVESLHEYAARYLHDHICRADLMSLSSNDQVTLVRRLMIVFSDKEILDDWIEMDAIYWYVQRAEAAEIIWKFLQHQVQLRQSELESSWTKKVVDGCESVSDFLFRLLRPMTIAFATKWLIGFDSLKVNIAYLAVHCYLTKGSNRSLGSTTESEGLPMIVSLGAKRIIADTEWARSEAGLQANAMFYCRLAKMLRDNFYLTEAVDMFEKALSMQQDLGLGRAGLAYAYAQQGNIIRAINTMNEAIQLCKARSDQKHQDLVPHLYSSVAMWQQELGNAVEAVALLRAAADHDQSTTERFSEYVIAAYALGLQYDITKAISERQGAVLSQILGVADSNTHKCLRRALRVTGKFDMVEDAFADAIKKARMEDRHMLLIHLEMQYSYLAYYHTGKHEEAERIWKRMIRAELPQSWYARESTNMLTDYYFNKAMAAYDGKSPVVFEEWREKLRALHRKSSDRDPNQASYDSPDGRTALERTMESEVSLHEGALVLALLYRLTGNPDANPLFLGHMNLAMDLLSDDDIDNDWTGYKHLAMTLAKAGRLVDARIALILFRREYCRLMAQSAPVNESHAKLIKTETFAVKSDTLQQRDKSPQGVSILESESIEQREEQRTSGDVAAAQRSTPKNSAKASTSVLTWQNSDAASLVTGQLQELVPHDQTTVGTTEVDEDWSDWDSFSCDGPCFRKGGDWRGGLHFCTYCIDCQMCSDCIGVLKRGELPYYQCGKNHEFIFFDKPAEKLPPKKVRIGEDLVELSVWLEKLKRDFDLPVNVTGGSW